jgi:hypothetical protein
MGFSSYAGAEIGKGLQSATDTLLQIQMYKQKMAADKEQNKIEQNYKKASTEFMESRISAAEQKATQDAQTASIINNLLGGTQLGQQQPGQQPNPQQPAGQPQAGGNPIAAASSVLKGGGALPQTNSQNNGKFASLENALQNLPPGVEIRSGGITLKNPNGETGGGDVSNMTPEEARADLKKRNPAYANYLNSLAEGRMTMGGRTTGKMMQVQKDLATYYPEMDQSTINARYATRKDFTTGTAAKNIKSLNTAVGHLAEMKKLIPQLHNSGVKFWNQLGQTTSREFGGNPTLARFKSTKVALSGELSNIYKNSGGTDQEIKQISDSIDSADSQDTLEASVDEAISLMGSRMDALQDQWHNAFDRQYDKDFPVISPRSKQVLKSMGYDITNNTNNEGNGGVQGNTGKTSSGLPYTISQ